MQFCCSIFEDLLDSAGERGLAVVVISGGRRKKYAFLLQGRATSADQPFEEVTSYPVALEMTMGIAFCPNCGEDLERYYAHATLHMRPELAPAWAAAYQRS
jgi:hypothetical protein